MSLKGKWGMVILVMVLFMTAAAKSEAFVLINEFLADPPTGAAGDANGDGITSSTQDEFIELFNHDSGSADLSGWYLSDAVSKRHVFADNFHLLPWEAIVVFGGGAPNLPGISWQVASTGGLSLNNTGDTISLYNRLDELIDQIIYGAEGNHDQSLVRSPEGEDGDLIEHLQLTGADGRRFSPGYLLDSPQPEEQVQPATTVVPEIPSVHYLWAGFVGMLAIFKIRKADQGVTYG